MVSFAGSQKMIFPVYLHLSLEKSPSTYAEEYSKNILKTIKSRTTMTIKYGGNYAAVKVLNDVLTDDDAADIALCLFKDQFDDLLEDKKMIKKIFQGDKDWKTLLEKRFKKLTINLFNI